MINSAFVFPGQGSQTVGMLSDFLPQYPIIKSTFVEASDALSYDLWHLIQEGPAEKLNQTEHTQAAMLTADVAVFRLLRQRGLPMPQFMAGHSLGEYAALVCADSLSLTEAAPLVARRGQLMQQTVPLGLGAMAAVVGLTDEQVVILCQQASSPQQQVTPANYNAIGQVVVAGHTQAVKRLLDLADEAGALLAKIIPVSVPCHCALLSDASELFLESLNAIDFKKPSATVFSNVDLSSYDSATQIRSRLKEQLYSPVRWVEIIQLFKNNGVNSVVECGPGKVLSGLVKRIERTLTAISVYDTISLDHVLEHFHIPV